MPIKVDEKGICPHCNIANRFEYAIDKFSNDIHDIICRYGQEDSIKKLEMCRCTNCGKVIIFFNGEMIHPLGSSREPCPLEVPEDIANDYKEAVLVEPYSKKAAAALARRCLQNVLHERGIKAANLDKEIEEAIKSLPSHLSEAIDAIRIIGNFAAHPIKYQQTGEIVDVEEGEAEWVLDVIEELFDFYYVSPEKLKEKRATLNVKLNEAGKPELK